MKMLSSSDFNFPVYNPLVLRIQYRDVVSQDIFHVTAFSTCKINSFYNLLSIGSPQHLALLLCLVYTELPQSYDISDNLTAIVPAWLGEMTGLAWTEATAVGQLVSDMSGY